MNALLEATVQRVKEHVRPVYDRFPLRFRAPSIYWHTLALLTESQFWDEDRIKGYEVMQLRRMLQHCASQVPYYRRLFHRIGFDPALVRQVSDLTALPTLDKETVRLNLQDLLAENIPASKRVYYTTGGTMGKPLGFWGLREAGWRERAFMETQWMRVGFHRDRLRAMLKGTVVKNRSHWLYDPRENAFVFSIFHMTPEVVTGYAAMMKERNIPYLHTYPSAAIDFARILKDRGITPPPFETMLLGSENFYPGQREWIESFYGCRVYSWYGHSENTVLAGECEQSCNYHIFPEYGFAEVLREDGSAATREDETGELVGTTLYNPVMPLLRYRTGDWAVIGPERCACGRHYRLLKEMRGRWLQEMLIGRSDNLISMTALNMHSDIFDRVQQFQFYQCEKGKAVLRIVPKCDYTDRDSAAIMRALQAKMSDSMDIELELIDTIPLTERGKFKFVVQELQLPKAEFGTTREKSA